MTDDITFDLTFEELTAEGYAELLAALQMYHIHLHELVESGTVDFPWDLEGDLDVVHALLSTVMQAPTEEQMDVIIQKELEKQLGQEVHVFDPSEAVDIGIQ